MTTQLRGVLSAEQSAKVAEEDQDDRSVRPVVPESVRGIIRADELDLLQAFKIHGQTLSEGVTQPDGHVASGPDHGHRRTMEALLGWRPWKTLAACLQR